MSGIVIHLHSCMEKDSNCPPVCLESLLNLFLRDMGGQNEEKLCSPAWNYGPKQSIKMWLVYMSSLELYPEHAVTCPCIPGEGETMLN